MRARKVTRTAKRAAFPPGFSVPVTVSAMDRWSGMSRACKSGTVARMGSDSVRNSAAARASCCVSALLSIRPQSGCLRCKSTIVQSKRMFVHMPSNLRR